jgi:hypothetical protein
MAETHRANSRKSMAANSIWKSDWLVNARVHVSLSSGTTVQKRVHMHVHMYRLSTHTRTRVCTYRIGMESWSVDINGHLTLRSVVWMGAAEP